MKQFKGDHPLSGNVHQLVTGKGVSVCVCVCVCFPLPSNLEMCDPCHMSSLEPVYTAGYMQCVVDL